MEINLHDMPERHVYGEALLIPNSVTTNTNGAAGVIGSSNASAREDHQHGSSKIITISQPLLGVFISATDALFHIWFPQFEVLPTVTYPVGPYTSQVNEIFVAFRTPTGLLTDSAITKTSLIMRANGMAGGTKNNPCQWLGGSIVISVP